MSLAKFLLVLWPAVLLVLVGCGTIEKDKKSNAMDAAVYAYGVAIRWGYYETAYGYVHPDRREKVPKELENIRVTSYEVVQPPIMKEDAKDMEQVVRVEYVRRDEQRVRSLSDRQHWRYDEESGTWWLHSGVPHFE